ncbi:MAG: 50S ribosomal protein L2, partial [Deltaproteobacteria bacterium]|nr:50S ribosomal protein L2 [Deltaproteobacteria bacterium]
MTVRNYKPTSPARRFYGVINSKDLTKKEPEKRLIETLKRWGGRNNLGRLTVRHQGGGHKRKYRIIDFRRDKLDISSQVSALEYDPNRSARIALLHYKDGEKRYILAPEGLKIGDSVVSGDSADIRPGNCLPMQFIPLGTMVHNVELHKGRGGQIVRSAGSAAQLMAKEGEVVQLKLPSGEVREILASCRATVGQVGNLDHENVIIGKAGRQRWLGIRPTVRGVAMNPIDHPHGGGEGNQPIGLKSGPKTYTGKLALGVK